MLLNEKCLLKAVERLVFVLSSGCEARIERVHSNAGREVTRQSISGKTRPLGIPVIKDRVVQAAVVPIFEVDFEDCSHGFRSGPSAHQALEHIAAALKAGKTEVYDADLEGYLDSIPHDKLMKCFGMRVVDGAVLGLIKHWLKAPVVEEVREGGKRDGKPRLPLKDRLEHHIALRPFPKLFLGKASFPGELAICDG
jgi:retron-type reverse transcriptase